MEAVRALAKGYGNAGPRGYRTDVGSGLAPSDLDRQDTLHESSRGIELEENLAMGKLSPIAVGGAVWMLRQSFHASRQSME